MDTQETKVYIAFLIAACVLGVIIIYFIISALRQQRSNQALYNSKIQAEIITLEKERSRVAHDLHDELGPVLLAVKYNLNSFELNEQHDGEVLEKTNQILDNIIKRVREISNNLMPETLLRKGLISAIEESTRQAGVKTGLKVEFTHRGINTLPLEQSVNIYRIVQEIIHNTIKHAYASRLIIELKQEDGIIYLQTEDDGCGFNYLAGASEFTGLGLRSLLSRADILKGTMYLDSNAGNGTRYIFEIPV